jgi:uncharacterized DUF497 family protein
LRIARHVRVKMASSFASAVGKGLDTSVVYGYTVGMAVKFDFDPKKAEANRHKHKVSFAQACDVWNDTLAIDEPDDRQDYAEERFNRIGMADGRLLVVTYTSRFDNGDEVIRIISARAAAPRERRKYHEA